MKLLKPILGVMTSVVLSAGFAQAGVDELPANIQNDLYNPAMIDPMQPLDESAYRDFGCIS